MTELYLPGILDQSQVEAVRTASRKGSIERLMLIDNGHLAPTFGNYQVIFDVVSDEALSRFPGIDIQTYRAAGRLSAYSEEQVAEIASLCIDKGVDAALIAVCDIGVSQPSTLLAGMLERAGIPTCLISQGIGVQLVENTCRNLGQRIPSATVTADWTSSAEYVRHDTLRVLPSIFSALLETQPEFEPPPAAAFSSKVISIEEGEFTEFMRRFDLSDGLPLVAPTEERIAEMLAGIGGDESREVWPPIMPRRTPLTVRDVAIVAVMAGCRPEWGWGVVAAYQAMAHPDFHLPQASTTTHPCGTFVFFSGPRATASGIAGGPGCLGPGYPANATVGRAVALAARLFMGSIQGAADLTRQGSPAEFTFCCAENLDESPWPSFTEDVCGEEGTSVTVLKVEGPHNVADRLSKTPADLLDTLSTGITNIASNNAFVSTAQTFLALNPLHAKLIAAAGWGRSDVQRYLFERARVDAKDRVGHGTLPHQPRWFSTLDRVPITERPEDILVAVVGAGGPHSAVMVPWGYSRGTPTLIPAN